MSLAHVMVREPDPASLKTLDLTPIWSFVGLVADIYESRRRHLGSTRAWRGSGSTHLPGMAGQIAVALITGQPVSVDLLDGGDGGTDIGQVDIKTSCYWPPILKHPVAALRWPPYFALAHLSEDRVVTFVGTVTADDLRGPRSYTATFNADAGEQHCLDWVDVRALYLERGGRH